MAAKPKSTSSVKAGSKSPSKATAAKVAKSPVKTPKASLKMASSASGQSVTGSTQSEWLQDVSIEAPFPANAGFLPGDRSLEFSVGMRQQDVENMVRSELRARALVHAGGEVLVMLEASYVNLAPQGEVRADLPQYLYGKLRERMESLFLLTGHTPPLPSSLEKVA